MKNYKAKLLILALPTIIGLSIIAWLIFGTNKNTFDTTYSYNKVIIQIGGNSVAYGEVENWTDYSDSDMVQVKVNGNYYYTHSTNVVLIKEGE